VSGSSSEDASSYGFAPLWNDPCSLGDEGVDADHSAPKLPGGRVPGVTDNTQGQAETPIAYTALTTGTAVLDADGAEIGTVEHVLQDSTIDLFDGIAVTTANGLRFVDAGVVGRITTAAVHTTLTAAQAEALPEPEGTEVFDADPDEFGGNGLSAWFGRMFMREHWMRRND